jgi:predicted dehydrogenase
MDQLTVAPSRNELPTAFEPVRWGILGAARIAVSKVIPAMQRSERCHVVAIASRHEEKARAEADRLGIPTAYGSYEALIDDPRVEAVYIPLPNHMHVPWSVRAAEAGKHVLCEKPIALSAAEARQLLAARDRTGVMIGEAFMVRVHPQWMSVRELVRSGRIGELRLVSGHFSYFRRDAADIRSRVEFGGGALMDIGCYPIMLSRWLFGSEPTRVTAEIEYDPELGVDRLASALLRFPTGHATFTCAGQLVPYQRMHIFGTLGRIEVEVPFNPPDDRPARLMIDDGRAVGGASAEVVEFPAVDQFTLQGDRFAEAIRGLGPLPMSLEDSVANMTVIDDLVRSAAARP